MEYKRIDVSQIDSLWELQRQYKAEIGEDAPGYAARERLVRAIREENILFYGAWEGDSVPSPSDFPRLIICPAAYLKIFSSAPTSGIRGSPASWYNLPIGRVL